jgi:hypothetical protein
MIEILIAAERLKKLKGGKPTAKPDKTSELTQT